ncbi:hypothetical protein ACFQZ4_35030 [Catellatospora coxensis]
MSDRADHGTFRLRQDRVNDHLLAAHSTRGLPLPYLNQLLEARADNSEQMEQLCMPTVFVGVLAPHHRGPVTFGEQSMHGHEQPFSHLHLQ